ncbi:MAG: ATP-binding cassette domain-containing protein [Bryobacterales bacterium]
MWRWVENKAIDEMRFAKAVGLGPTRTIRQALPDGLDTLAGERGVRLSGGERQRLAVARALYAQPDVLVFDEATAALDNRTEQALTETIERLHGRKTMLMVAHRLSTVQRCDKLLFLQDGRVADVGSYGELLERNLEFRAMAAPIEAC